MTTDLKAGDIFTWKDYPLSMDTAKPRRWFLFLGNNTLQKVIYQITTTTQYQHYESGGNRTGNNFFKIEAGIGGLEKESILDLSLFEEIPESLFDEWRDCISKTGTLNQDYVNKFIKHLKKDRHIITIYKKDILRYLKEAGFNV